MVNLKEYAEQLLNEISQAEKFRRWAEMFYFFDLTFHDKSRILPGNQEAERTLTIKNIRTGEVLYQDKRRKKL